MSTNKNVTSSSNSDDTLGAIYAAFVAQCRPYRWTGPWAQVPAGPGALRGPKSVPDMLERLVRQFPQADLIASGIVRVDNVGGAAMHPGLAVSKAPCLAIRRPGTDQIVDLLTADGCCRHQSWPIFSVLFDGETRAALKRDPPLLILTCDLIDTMLLRALGLAAAPINGLEQLDATTLRYFAAAIGIPLTNHQLRDTSENYNVISDRGSVEIKSLDPFHSYSEVSVAEDKDYRAGAKEKVGRRLDVTIALCSLCKDFAPATPEAKAAVDRLAAYGEHVELNIDRFRLWTPSASSIERIHFLANKHSPGWLKSALVESLNDDRRVLSDTQQQRKPQHDWSRANEKLNEVYRRPTDDGSGQLRMAAEKNFRKHYQDQIVDPLLALIPHTADPLERFRIFEFANLAEMYSEQALRVRRLMSDPRRVDDHAADEALRQLLHIGAQLSTKLKGLTTWPQMPIRFARVPRVVPTLPAAQL